MSETIYICKVCTRTLDTLVNETGVHQIHTVADMPADHEPDPMAMPEGWSGGRCDFCSEEPVKFLLPAEDFRMPHDPHSTSGGDWAMCRECAELVGQNRWTAVVRRAADGYRKRHGPVTEYEYRQVYTQIGKAYRKLRNHVTGAVRPIV